MRIRLLLACSVLLSAAALAEPVERPYAVEGTRWLGTVVTPYNAAQRDNTYKVFTHLYDFAGKAPITKGAGGKFPHHRGLFIGWSDTLVAGQDYDTWHMSNCQQEHVAWLDEAPRAEDGPQRQRIAWRSLSGETFVEEERALSARPGGDGLRVVDFHSRLTATGAPVQLRGDLQHAGMQVRLSNEVVDNEAATRYILPDGATRGDDDAVTGAWWACCSTEMGGKRYWVLHMSHPGLPGGVPVYSIRGYARFGAFFEPDLAPGQPVDLHFRIVLSEKPLDEARCAALYAAYAAEAR
jgi:hypothetical protein